jgi:hypothetical protein
VVALLVLSLALSAAAEVACPDIVFFRVGDKFAVIGWGMEDATQELPPEPGEDYDFGGYRLWMREVWQEPDPSPESFTLVREYVYGEDNPQAAGYWFFPAFYAEELVCVEKDPVDADSCITWREGVRRDSAVMFQNAFPYEFSVSAFSASDPAAINYDHIDRNRTGVVYPRVGVKSDLASVKCIPNPYRASADWEYGGNRRVTFVGLPSRATIRIYTVAADLVRTIEHDHPESDQAYWDLKNEDGSEVAPGVYIYQVVQLDSGGGEVDSIESKVMIIK